MAYCGLTQTQLLGHTPTTTAWHQLQLTINVNVSAGEEAGPRRPCDFHPSTTSSRKPARGVFFQGESQRYHAIRAALTHGSHARSLVWRSGSPAGRVLSRRWHCYVRCYALALPDVSLPIAALGFCRVGRTNARWCESAVLERREMAHRS